MIFLIRKSTSKGKRRSILNLLKNEKKIKTFRDLIQLYIWRGRLKILKMIIY